MIRTNIHCKFNDGWLAYNIHCKFNVNGVTLFITNTMICNNSLSECICHVPSQCLREAFTPMNIHF